MSSSLFIDVDTRKRLHQVLSEDLSYLFVGNTLQSPSFTLHQLQKHVKTRCPAIIEHAKEISVVRKGCAKELFEDTLFTLQQLEGMRLGSEQLNASGAELKARIDRLRIAQSGAQ